MPFYLNQLRDVETDPQQTLTLSASTITLCEAALEVGFYRVNWIQDLEPLSDEEWAEAKQFVQTAIEELNAGG